MSDTIVIEPDNAVYTVWASEDEGFRFPVGEDAYTSYDAALAAAIKAGGVHTITASPDEIEKCSVPNTHGGVERIMSMEDGITSISDALKVTYNDPENLYAIDWVFIMRIPLV